MPSFNETFIDEGNIDEFQVMCTFRDVGFDGALLSNHFPRMEGSSQ